MKNKIVTIVTIYKEYIFCIILEEDKYRYFYKSEYGYGYIPKNEVLEIAIMGDVTND